ncbi:hypothetical protein, partial [Tetragenococcus halophilus]|uniref:hypothetical protein n=1 Tax=Tetragenococcus halophilus TaxID=51669 RepID=UPI00295EE947
QYKWSAVYENRTYGATGGAEILFPLYPIGIMTVALSACKRVAIACPIPERSPVIHAASPAKPFN